MKNKLIMLMLVWQSGSFATVNIAEEIKVSEKKQITNSRGKRTISTNKEKNKQQLQIEGYVDSNYVRVIVDISKNKLITGQMFLENGDATYVYGEFVEDVLHLYEPEGRHFTVIISK